ncbi:MAG: PAS domain S-box protein [Deltaproteobacteria bacterium]|nr:PAS domain S-box protein [Deltaproteobacteria bacterium]MBI3386966.1 PAS domain S-box protein [Deltaproteobacteria bacterium]
MNTDEQAGSAQHGGERALRQSEALTRAILDAAVDPVITIDEHGNVQSWNPAAERLFGYAAAEVIGHNVNILMPSPYSEEHDQYLANYRRTGERKLIGIGREVIGRRKDGTLFPLDLAVGEAHIGDQRIFTGIIRDITARKQAENGLRQSEARTRAILDAAADPIITIDEHGNVQSFNPAAERLFGYAAAEVIGRNVNMLMPSPYSEEHDQYLANYRRTGERKIIGIGREVLGRRKDGTLFPLELAVSEAYIGEQHIFTGIIRDITERKHREDELQRSLAELARSNRELEQFAHIASHDLQEPLRKIQSFSDRLISKYASALPDEARDYLTRAGDAANRMGTLIDDLMSFSRVTAKTHPFTSVDLNMVLRGVVSDLETRLDQTQGRIETEELPTIEADPMQMRQLFQNLLSNALKFHRPNAPPVVRVFTDETASTPDSATILIADNGIGFEEKYLDRIFTIFQRLRVRSEYPGTGLGLAICRKIVDRHQGDITARSTPGHGATFAVTLPLRHRSDERGSTLGS